MAESVDSIIIEFMKTSYKTSSLALAAVILVCAKAKLTGTEPEDSRRMSFIFEVESENEIQRLTTAFWAKEIRVEPLEYFNAIRSLKQMLYEERDK